MGYYESEILKELIVDELYTPRQLRIFLENSVNVLILSKSDSNLRFNDDSKKLRILDKIEAYAHTYNRAKNAHELPNAKSIVYVVE